VCVCVRVHVAGLISPWNFPLYLLTWKIAPAIATGNTVVAKPSEMTSVTAWMMCKLMQEAGRVTVMLLYSTLCPLLLYYLCFPPHWKRSIPCPYD